MDPVAVLIVDDHPVAREGLRAMLDDEPLVRVVGEAVDGMEAIDRVAELLPQVVLMDIRMPLMNGLEATHRIKMEHPATSVIMMTSYDDEALVIESVRVGAAGYLLKDVSRALLHHTIGAVAGGGMLIEAALLRKTISGLTPARQTKTDMRHQLPPEELTERERAVLKLMAEGSTNRVIADQLSLAEATVKKHVSTIIAKLGASDRTHAATTSIRIGLID